jgi:hypothetical protein
MKIVKGANLPPLIFGLVFFIVGLVFLKLPPTIPADTLSHPITDLSLYQIQALFSYLESVTISIPLMSVGLISIALGLALRKPGPEKEK